MAKKFGALIRNARIRKGLNQKELAAMLDVTNSLVKSGFILMVQWNKKTPRRSGAFYYL